MYKKFVRIRAHHFLVLLLIMSGHCYAQDEETVEAAEYHPAMSDTFFVGLGGFFPTKDFSVRVNGRFPNDEIDFDESLGVTEDDNSFAALFRWRFGEKWSLWGQFWTLDTNGGAVLEEDVEWEDLVFKQGSFVNAGVDMSVARIFFGRNFISTPQHEFGLGLGFHWMDINVFIEGTIETGDNEFELERTGVEAEFPLPNVGAWYQFSWHRDWMLQARLDWLDVSVGDYGGGLWNGLVGVNWQPFEHVGIGVSYSSFILDADVSKSDWRGGFEYDAHGPIINLTATW